MRIVHFSDIHARARLHSPAALFDKRGLGFLNYYLRRHFRQSWRRVQRAVETIPSLEPDLVLCTGDLTSVGGPREFDQAVEALMPLVDDDRFEFAYVPGNHDAYIQSEASLTALTNAFRLLNRERWELARLPVEWRLGQLRCLLVNQAVPAPMHASWGALSETAAEWLEEQLAERQGDTVNVLVSHFPILDAEGRPLSARRACRNIDCLHAALLEGRLDLALCGHIHTPFARPLPAGGYELCAGSLTATGLLKVIDVPSPDEPISQRTICIDPPKSP